MKKTMFPGGLLDRLGRITRGQCTGICMYSESLVVDGVQPSNEPRIDFHSY